MNTNFDKIYLSILSEESTQILEINGVEFPYIEIVETEEDKEKGLMFRTSIADGGGMVFKFKNSKPRSFWMKNTFIDLCLIYLDENDDIISYYNMPVEEPQQQFESEQEYESRLAHYPSIKPTKTAIEIKSKYITLLNLKIGDHIRWKNSKQI